VSALPRAVAAFAVLAALGGCRTCGGPPAVPKGPAPEYEDPPVPSWMDAGAAAPAAPAAPARTAAPDAG
jgi:hypothetical protein